MASTTAGQHQQPVMIRGFEVGINPSILSSNGGSNGTSLDSLQQQQQQLLYQQSLFAHASNSHAHGHTRRQSSSSSSSAAAPAAFMIPHVHAYGGSGVTTDELVDGLQQSMASMDAHHHHQPSHPRASSTSSNSSSNHGGHGNANGGGVSSNKPFEAVARSPTYNWHGYRPGSSGTASNNPANSNTTSTSPFDSFHSLPPNLTRHVSSPSSYFAAAASTTNGGQAQHHSQHRSPLDIFPSPSVASTLQLNPHGPASITTESSTPSAFGNYPFNDASLNNNNNNSFDGRLSSFHRHQAHAQSHSYSSAFSPSSFLVNGLNSPTNTTTTSNLNPSSHQASSFNPALSTQHPQANQKQQQQQSQKQAPQTKSPPLFDASSSASNNAEALQQGLNANNKRPGSTDSGHASMNGRGRTDSPNEEAKGASQQQQSRGRSQGRTPASGKAPSARSSRSRTRRPSYSRNISPAGVKNGNTSPSATTATANTSASGNGTNIPISQSSYPNPYAPQLSPYMPGYPSLPSGHVDQILASQPTSSNNELAFQQHAYGASAPTLSNAGLDFMKLNEHAQLLAQAHLLALHNQQQKQQQGQPNQQNQSQTPVAPPSRPASTFDILQASELNRRASNASTVGGEGGGGGGAPTLSNQATNDLLNSPAAFTGPLPLPHQEGFRTFGSLPAYLSALNGSVAGDGNKESEAGDAIDMEPTTRG